jgi:hypothetical protein
MRSAEENWKVLASLFPAGWRQTAWQSGAVERLRGFRSAEVLLRMRMLMLRVARGRMLRRRLCALSWRTGPTFRMSPCSNACATASSGYVVCVSNCFGKTSRTGSKKGIGRTISGCRVVGPVLAHNFRVADDRELGIVQIGSRWKLGGRREIGFTKAKWCSSPARAMRTSSRRTGSHTAAKECRRIPCAPPELVQHNVRLGCSE